MTTEIVLSAWLTGFLGSIHCIGMCGGIVGLLTISLPSRWPYLLAYNLGRLTSYTLAGILAGGIGAQFIQWLPLDNPRTFTILISGLFMIALGLYLGTWSQTLIMVLERLGWFVWKKIEPIGRRFLPVQTPRQALGLGAVWGWLPCGLVYSSLLTFAFSSASPLQGGLLMLTFGLGTLPMLLIMGVTTQYLVQHLIVRKIVGAIIILGGLLILLNHP